MLRDFLIFSLILTLFLSIIDFDIYYISFISNSKLKRVASKSTSLKVFTFLELLLFLSLSLRKSFIIKIIYIISS